MSLRFHLALSASLLGACSCGGGGHERVEPLALVTTSLPRGVVGAPYAVILEAEGGLPPIRFGIGHGEEPPGLTLHGDGRLEGTPSEAGTFTMAVSLEDAHGDHALGSLELVVDPEVEPIPPLRLLTDSLPPGDVGEPYEAALAAEGGTTPYVWTISAGTLPPGLALDAEAAAIVGTPTEIGVASVTVRLEDAAGDSIERTLEIAVSTPPVLLTKVFPIGVVGEPYAAQLEVTGGSWPLAFEVYSGTLPDGLVMNPSGLVAGVPSEIDSRPVRFRVTDAAGVTRDQRIRIWIVEDDPVESWADAVIPANCGLTEPVIVPASLRIEDPAMIDAIQVAIDVDYGDLGMLDIDLVAPDGTRVPIHVGGGHVGGSVGLHFMFETDRIAFGSFLPFSGLGPAGLWTLEVRVLADPGFGCIAEPGRLQRFALVIRHERSSEDYLRVHGFSPNNMIDGPFARITGGGLPQDTLDLSVERWSTGANGIPEGGTGDDVLEELVPLAWTTDLPPEVGVISPEGHFQSGDQTGRGTVTGTAGDTTIELPIKVVPPDWVP